MPGSDTNHPENERQDLRSLHILYFLLSITVILTTPACERVVPPGSKPNIILILADDLGWGDLSCYGGEQIPTPNLDSLASGGMRFTQFYAGSAVCTPTRASILTGNYPLRYNIRQYFPDIGILPSEAQTLAELLQDAGYSTAHIGKWHLGGIRKEQIEARAAGLDTVPGPNQQGFDHYYCMVEGGKGLPAFMDDRILYRRGARFLYADDRPVAPINRWLTDVFTDETIRLAGKYGRKRKPFFINLWFKTPHTPYEPAPEPFLSDCAETLPSERPGQNFHRGDNTPGDHILYYSMVANLDANVGRIVKALEEFGLKENTLLIFTSDNGPSYRGCPDPWTGGKADLFEGGIRVPMIAHWPGRIRAGTVSHQLSHTNDFLPTLCDLAGIPAENYKVDGISLKEVLVGVKPEIERPALFWQLDLSVDPWGEVWYPQPGTKPFPYATAVVRQGDMKMLTDSLKPLALFDLSVDSMERQNLLGTCPDLEAELLRILIGFLAEPRLDCGAEPFYRKNARNYREAMRKQ